MEKDIIQKIIYELVSKLFVFPIYKFVFKGNLIGRENIPSKDSFIMVSESWFLTRPSVVRSCPWTQYIFYG